MGRRRRGSNGRLGPLNSSSEEDNILRSERRARNVRRAANAFRRKGGSSSNSSSTALVPYGSRALVPVSSSEDVVTGSAPSEYDYTSSSYFGPSTSTSYLTYPPQSYASSAPSRSSSYSGASSYSTGASSNGSHLRNRMVLHGPANFVDPVTYSRIRRDARRPLLKKRKKKTATKKKAATKRSGGGGTYRTGGLNGMGPIVITGRGGYWADKLQAGASGAYRALQRGTPTGMFSRLGRAAGGAMFGGPGALVGGGLGQGVADVLGFGNYQIRKNDLMQISEGIPVPTFQDLNQGIVVCHREFIGNITQSIEFTNNSYIIQPGDTTTFPWLSGIAPHFEQYEMLGCLFQFRSTASDFGTVSNMAMGTVIMSTDYDATDLPFASKLEMENSQYCMSGKPSVDIIHPIECDPDSVGPTGLKYTRSGPVPTGRDPRFYDHGNFQLATTGMPADTGDIGELWVTYKVAFYKPQFHLGVTTKSDRFTGVTGIDSTNLGQLPSTASADNSFGSRVEDNHELIFSTKFAPPGSLWLVVYQVTGTATGGQVMSTPTIINGIITGFRGNPVSATNQATVSAHFFVTIGQPSGGVGTVLTFTNDCPDSPTSANLIVSQWDYDHKDIA